ncbi:hypothetical protein [Microlunatus speluncae]|uniref:hypothetical protein n=1 Tax=Microlunatus speluncae TaxID=2594267 RepID=UPI0012664DFB|nr:hypothetical protein [Microlunatus speluncae]
MRKLMVCGLVVAVSAVFGGLLVGSPGINGVAETPPPGQPDYGLDGVRVVSLMQSEERRVDATVAVHVRGVEGRPLQYRSAVELRCQVKGADSIWRPHSCSANFGQRLVRDQSTVIESWSELSSDDGVIVSVGEWQPVTCRGLYTTELVAYQIGVAGQVTTVKGNPGLFPSNGVWADC